uniref:Uncharacterized protein n=1 Tax=Phenylobacterium glaciei TaxID=2803784 RepID=A0A974S7D0_9CAUL|nr:hypothetical protein JKL49_22920 [Phenylobacterium glaciei]
MLTAQVTYDLGWADLKYIGGFQQYNYQTGGDYDGTSRTAAIAIPGMVVPYFPTRPPTSTSTSATSPTS